MIVPATEYDSPTIPVVIRRAARLWPDRDFVVTPDKRLTFGDAERLSRSLAHRLIDAGVGKGTRVAFQLPNGPDWTVVWLAVTRIGALALPLSTAYTANELRTTLRHSDAALLIVASRDVDATTRLLEEAVPGLSEAEASSPLRLAAVPMLRSIWFATDALPKWATGLSLEPQERSSADEALLEAIEAEVTPADWMIVIHTSGTTSSPKGVIHTHGSGLRHGWNFGHFSGLQHDGKHFCSLPFFWVGGVGVNLSSSLAIGCTVLCMEQWEPNGALDLMEREGATRIWMWAHHLRRLFDLVRVSGRDVSRIPYFNAAAAAAVADPTLRHNSLGMTETWGPHTAGGPESTRVLPEELRGSFGLPITGVEHRIVDPETGEELTDGREGELCVRGYSLMAGMIKRERHETFDDDGWLHTGDRGRFVDGCFIFTGRIDHMIKTAGANVAPREVEEALERHPSVAMAIVVGVPDEARGEIVAATVVPRPRMQVTIDELQQHVAASVSSYKVPRRWLVLNEDDVPMLASGKPDIRALAQRLAQAEGTPLSE